MKYRMAIVIGLLAWLSYSVQAAEPQKDDLSRFFSPDFYAAVVVHPEQIAHSPLKATLPQDWQKADAAAVLNALVAHDKLPPGIDTAKLVQLLEGKPVHRVVLLLNTSSQKTGDAGLIVQFSIDVDGAAILAAVNKDWQPGDIQGIPCQKIKDPQADAVLAACVMDARTIVLGSEPIMVKMLAPSQSSSPLLEQLRKTSLNHDVIVEIAVEPALAGIAAATGKSKDKVLEDAGPQAAMAKEVQSLSLTLDFSGPTLFHAELATAKKETAGGLGMMVMMSLAQGKAHFAEFKKQPPPTIPPTIMEPVIKLGDEALRSLSIKTNEANLVLDLPMPKYLPDALKAASEFAKTAAAKQIPVAISPSHAVPQK